MYLETSANKVTKKMKMRLSKPSFTEPYVYLVYKKRKKITTFPTCVFYKKGSSIQGAKRFVKRLLHSFSMCTIIASGWIMFELLASYREIESL